MNISKEKISFTRKEAIKFFDRIDPEIHNANNHVMLIKKQGDKWSEWRKSHTEHSELPENIILSGLNFICETIFEDFNLYEDLAFYHPLSKVPLYVNSSNNLKLVCEWRLSIGK